MRFDWRPLHEVSQSALPSPLKALTFEDLLARVHRNVEPDDHCDALVLVHAFLDLMRSWYTAWPDTPELVCRGVLQGLIEGDFSFDTPGEIGRDEATDVAIVGVGYLWKLTAFVALRGRKRELPKVVSRLLLEVFEENELLARSKVS